MAMNCGRQHALWAMGIITLCLGLCVLVGWKAADSAVAPVRDLEPRVRAIENQGAVHSSKLDGIKQSLDRMSDKLDRHLDKGTGGTVMTPTLTRNP